MATRESSIRCRRCALPDRFPGVRFGEDGECIYCATYDLLLPRKVKETERLKVAFLSLIEHTVAAGGNRHDCIVAYSGGKDSTAMLLNLRRQFGSMKILAHTLDSWTRAADREREVYKWAIVLGGFGAPIFLFLAGIALALAAGSRLDKGASEADVAARARRRIQPGQHRLAAARGTAHEVDRIAHEAAAQHRVEAGEPAGIPFDAVGERQILGVEGEDGQPPGGDRGRVFALVVGPAAVLVHLDGAAAALAVWPVTQNEFWLGTSLRLGIVLAALWLAWPQVTRLPAWLGLAVLGIALGAVFLARRWPVLLAVAGALLLAALIRPRPRPHQRSQTTGRR